MKSIGTGILLMLLQDYFNQLEVIISEIGSNATTFPRSTDAVVSSSTKIFNQSLIQCLVRIVNLRQI